MSNGDSYHYDKAEPKYKSDAEKRRNNREAEKKRAEVKWARGSSTLKEDLRRLDPDND